MKNKLTVTATLVLAMIFGTIVLPHTTSAETTINFTSLFQRGENCSVVGSNDKPLRVRATPGGKIIGSLKFGTQISMIYDRITDRTGYDWSKIKFKKGYGWVASEFIMCR